MKVDGTAHQTWLKSPRFLPFRSAKNPADYATEKDDLAQTGNDQNQTGLAVQIHLIRASKPANNIREFTDQSSILNRSHYRSPIASISNMAV